MVSSFSDYLVSVSETIFWDHGDREPWDLETSQSAPVHDGASWFFVVSHPRTGSTAAVDHLNAHPAIHCGNEDHVLPLLATVLGSRLMMSAALWDSVRYRRMSPLTPLRLRLLLDAWRAGLSDRPRFGDKGEMYYGAFEPACDAVFPGCKYILTVRRPLDALGSYLSQPWALDVQTATAEEMYTRLQARAWMLLERNLHWRERAVVVCFDELTSESAFREIWQGVFNHLDVDPSAFAWKQRWAACRYGEAMRKYDDHPTLVAFLEWLRTNDEPLYAVLRSGTCYSAPGG